MSDFDDPEKSTCSVCKNFMYSTAYCKHLRKIVLPYQKASLSECKGLGFGMSEYHKKRFVILL